MKMQAKPSRLVLIVLALVGLIGTIVGQGVGQPATAVAATLSGQLVQTGTPTLTVRAYVDGRSHLIIQGNIVHWHHLDFVAPGRHQGADEPTALNGKAWLPTWPDVPDPENGDCDCDSSSFAGIPPLADQSQTVALDLIAARDQVTIIQQPDQSNGFTLIVEFNDNDLGNPDWYEIGLTYVMGAVEVDARNEWQDTGIVVKAGDQVQVTYLSGAWNIWQDADPATDANGQVGRHEECALLPTADISSLIGRVGGSTPHFLGNSGAFFAQEHGTLQLSINDCAGQFVDNGGTLHVQVTIAPTLRVRAFIDGRSWLIVQGNTVHWRHFDFAVPGRELGANEPTELNGVAWFPEWPDDPDAENRDCDCDSSSFVGVPSLSAQPQTVAVSVVQARGNVMIIQQPEESNGFTLIIEFDDNAPANSDWYEIGLSYLQAPTITIVKDAQPGLKQNFRFTGDLGNFRLDDAEPDDGDRHSNAKTFTVAPGTYMVKEQRPAGWILASITCTPADKGAVDLGNWQVSINVTGGDNVTCTFVNQRNVTVNVLKYHDRNGNRRRDANEPGLPDWTMRLYDAQQNEIGVQVTDTAGQTAFIQPLPSGAYTICEELSAGWVNRQPRNLDPTYGQPCYRLMLAAGQRANVRFGNRELVATSATESDVPEGDDGVLLEAVPEDKDDAGYDEVDLFLPFIRR